MGATGSKQNSSISLHSLLARTTTVVQAKTTFNDDVYTPTAPEEVRLLHLIRYI
jgi:hypothetical protein